MPKYKIQWWHLVLAFTVIAAALGNVFFKDLVQGLIQFDPATLDNCQDVRTDYINQYDSKCISECKVIDTELANCLDWCLWQDPDKHFFTDYIGEYRFFADERECEDILPPWENQDLKCQMECMIPNSCVPNLVCGAWGACIDSIERRECEDGCGFSTIETRVCNGGVEPYCGDGICQLISESKESCPEDCSGGGDDEGPDITLILIIVGALVLLMMLTKKRRR